MKVFVRLVSCYRETLWTEAMVSVSSIVSIV